MLRSSLSVFRHSLGNRENFKAVLFCVHQHKPLQSVYESVLFVNVFVVTLLLVSLLKSKRIFVFYFVNEWV